MRYLRKFVRRVGLVSTLLIGGVLGGLMAPPPSEAMTISIDGKDLPVSTLFPYTCETGYSSCWYIIGSATSPSTNTRQITGPTGTWTVANIAGTNRARVRINDVGGTPATNVDKMNLTGIKLTPPANTTGKTTKIIIKHTYINGQGSGNYQWGMGATGHFTPSPATADVLQNKFILTGRGKFKTPTAATDPDGDKQIGKIDKGPFGDGTPPVEAGDVGIVTQTVPVTTVKTGCNSDDTGKCKPEMTYEYELKFVGADTLTLTDSFIGAGISCTDAELDPLIPQVILFLMRLVDPTGVLPTHISGLNDWIDAMAVKYNLNSKQLAKVEKVKVALGNWLLNQTCAGKAQLVLNTDSTRGQNAGRLAGGKLVTTCSDTNTCGTGTIVIKKTMSPDIIESFGFTGTGSGITDFGILTDQDVCNDGCMGGSQTFSLLQTGSAGGSRTIKETSFPAPPGGHDPWRLDSVTCDGEYYQVEEVFDDGEGPLVGIKVNDLNDNQTLTCTFHNFSSSDDGED